MNTTVREVTALQQTGEMSAVESLLQFTQVLQGIGHRRDDAPVIAVPVTVMKEMAAFMLDYRRQVEEVYGTLPKARFRSIGERNNALDAYQFVCQRARELTMCIDVLVE